MIDMMIRCMNWFHIARTVGEFYNFLMGFLIATLFWGALGFWVLRYFIPIR